MCINKTKVYNRFFRRSIWVDCGCCPACQQKRANKRASRIRANVQTGYQCLFLHLTYMNECCPYVLQSDIEARKDRIPVYRDYDRRWSRRKDKRRRRNYLLSYHRQLEPIGYLDLTDDHGLHEFDSIDDVLKNVKSLKPTYRRRITTLSTDGKIGIIYYPDVQNYIKKLKANLARKYNIDVNEIHFSYYITSEYGTKEKSFRPHFHLLVFFPRSLEAQFRQALVENWTFSFRSITERKLQPAVSAAKYAASYVNKPADFPPLLSCHSFKQKFSYSQGFGMAVRDFSFDKVCEKIRNGNLTYVRKIVHGGSPVESVVPLPSYVISRYFPKIKGYSRITDGAFCSLFDNVDNDRGDAYSVRKANGQLILLQNLRHLNAQLGLEYTEDDLVKNSVSLFNHMVRSCMPAKVYAQYFTAAWRQRSSQSYRLLLEGKSIYEQLESYDNIGDYFSGDVPNESLDDMIFDINPDYVYEVDPNCFKLNIALTEHLEQEFTKYVKQRSVNASYENLFNYAEI